jgi:hypothetical protein
MWKWLRRALPPDPNGMEGTFSQRHLEVDRLRANLRPECKHHNSYIREIDPIGDAYCPDCDALVRVSIWLNNLADKVRRA